MGETLVVKQLRLDATTWVQIRPKKKDFNPAASDRQFDGSHIFIYINT